MSVITDFTQAALRPDATHLLFGDVVPLGVGDVGFAPEDDAAPAFMPAIPRGNDLGVCPPLPDDAQLAPELALGASPWLDGYVAWSRQWSPQSWEGYHTNVGLGILAAVAARRVTYNFGGERFTSLMLANLGRSSIWAKSTAQRLGRQMLCAAGLDFLLVSDTTTPQALVRRMSVSGVSEWDDLTLEQQANAKLKLAFAGQRGWLADEFGGHIGAMMRADGPMSDFVGLLRVLDDGLPTYSSDTIVRGNAVIQRPYLSLLVSFTPADVLKYAGKGGPLWTNGFWARFAFTCPPPDAHGTDARFPDGPCTPPADLVRALREWHERLGIPEVEVSERLDDAGKPLKDRSWQTTITHRPPIPLGYGDDVKNAVYNYRNALRRLIEGFAVTDFDGSYARFPEKALRVAALLASVDGSHYITMRHWAKAQAIAEGWRQSLHHLYQTLNTATVSEESEREDRIVDIVLRLGGATVNDFRRYIRGVSAFDVVRGADALVKAGVLRVENTRKGTKRYLHVES